MFDAIKEWRGMQAICKNHGIEMDTDPRDCKHIFPVQQFRYEPKLRIKESPD